MTVVHYGLTWPKDPCQVWVEFEGKSKIWIPKSITIRKLIMEPEYFPVTENLNSISFPIIKFYFDGVLSLTESYGIHKLRPKGLGRFVPSKKDCGSHFKSSNNF